VGGNEKELRKLYRGIDKNGNKVIEKEEFIEFFGDYAPYLYKLPAVMRSRLEVPVLVEDHTVTEVATEKAFYSPYEYGLVSTQEQRRRDAHAKENARKVGLGTDRQAMNSHSLIFVHG